VFDLVDRPRHFPTADRFGDVFEVAPQYDVTTITAQVGAQIVFQLLCLVALRKL
jgi:hypothetical protein